MWNFWIIYPLIALVLATAGHVWFAYGRKPISESEVRREIELPALVRDLHATDSQLQ